MTKLQFLEYFRPIEDVFGKYSPFKLDRIYYFVQHLELEQFRAITLGLIDSGKKPEINHFKEKSRIHALISNQEFEIKIQCEICQDSGIINLIHRDFGSAFSACNCFFGKRNHDHWKIKFAKEFNKDSWRMIPYREWCHLWRKNDTECLSEKIALWKNLIKSSLGSLPDTA